MSSVQIVHQVQLFGQAVLFGCCMLLVYDLIRIFRRVAAHGVVWIAVEDMFFWVISAFVLFQFLYQEDDGKVRGFVILAMFLGMLLYGRLCSRGVVKGGTFLLQRLCGGVRSFFRGIMKPVKIMVSPVGKCAQCLRQICKKRNRYVKKRLKNCGKQLKWVYISFRRTELDCIWNVMVLLISTPQQDLVRGQIADA